MEYPDSDYANAATAVSEAHKISSLLTESMSLPNLASLHDDSKLPSNNSSRTFCDRPPASPDATKQPNEPPSVTYGFATDANTATLDPSAYHASPFNFHYDGTPDDYMRYRPDLHPVYSGLPYDMSYMQHLAHLSAHVDDSNAAAVAAAAVLSQHHINSAIPAPEDHQHYVPQPSQQQPSQSSQQQQPYNLPIGKRRPRSIMISGEPSADVNKGFYENRAGAVEPSTTYTESEEYKQHHAFNAPSMSVPGRYYYPVSL
jgi:hypothetical protein